MVYSAAQRAPCTAYRLKQSPPQREGFHLVYFFIRRDYNRRVGSKEKLAKPGEASQ